MVIPKGVDDPDSPLPGPEIVDVDMTDIGESSAWSRPRTDDVSATSKPAAVVNSERIIAPMKLQTPRARRAESVSSAVSCDLERGEALPRTNHSSISSRLSAGTNSTDNIQDQLSAYHSESNRSSERRRSPDPHGTIANDDESLFVAFRESRWIRSVVIAKIGFVVMTLMVLGNLIYS